MHINTNMKGSGSIKDFLKLYKTLNCREFSLAMILSHFVSDDGVLRVNGKYFVGTEFCDYLGDKYNVFNKALTSLKRKGVIGRVRVKSEFWYITDHRVWVANPNVYEVKDCKPEIIEWFKKYEW